MHYSDFITIIQLQILSLPAFLILLEATNVGKDNLINR